MNITQDNKVKLLARIELDGPVSKSDLRDLMRPWSKERTERVLEALCACGSVRRAKGLYETTGAGLPRQQEREAVKYEPLTLKDWTPTRPGADDHKRYASRGF